MKKWLFILCLPSVSWGATLTVVPGGGNWISSTTWDGGTTPTQADDCVMDAASGQLTALGQCRCGSFTNILAVSSFTHNAATTIVIKGTVTLSGTAAYLRRDFSTSAWSFLGGAASTNTITLNGQRVGNTTYGGDGSVWIWADSYNTASTATVTITSGVVHTDGASDTAALSHTIGLFSSANTNPRSIYLGRSSMTITGTGGTPWNIGTVAGGTFFLNESTITLTGASSILNHGAGGGVAGTYNAVTFTGGGTSQLLSGSSGINISSLTYIGTASKTNVFSITSGRNVVISKYLLFYGDSIVNRPIITAAAIGSQSTFTVTGATVVFQNTDFRDMCVSPAWNLTTSSGGVGDAGGNCGITFNTPTTQTNSGSTSFDWDTTNSWTSRIPLPQDDVVIDGNFASGRTINVDMARLGNNVDLSAATWSGTAPIFSNAVANTVYGSFALPVGFSWSGNAGFTFEPRSKSVTINTGGLTIATGVTFNGFASTATLASAFSQSVTSLDIETPMVFNSNNYSVTGVAITFTTNAGQVVNMGSSTWTATGPGIAWNAGANSTINSQTSTIFMSNTSGTTKTFTGGSKTYYDVIFATSPQQGRTTISGNNTFRNLIIYSSKTVSLTAGSTQTITGALLTDGTSISSVTFQGSTIGGAPGTLVGTSEFKCLDWLSLRDVYARGGQGWYYGDNSTIRSGVTGWLPGPCPTSRPGFNIFGTSVTIRGGSMNVGSQ